MPYFLEIYNNGDHYEGRIHQGDVSSAYTLSKIELGPSAEITIKGKSYTLGYLVQVLITSKKEILETSFDERVQLELGQYLYTQTLGRWQNGHDHHFGHSRMSDQQRLKRRIDGLQQQWELLNKKLNVLKKQEILENRVEEKLRLETLIKETETKYNRVEQELNVLNDPLSKTDSDAEEVAGRNDDQGRQNAPDPRREADIQLRILSEDEHILRLPWVLLAYGGSFLSVSGWSVTLGSSHALTDCELPPSPYLLVVMPQPTGVPETEAQSHLKELEEMLSQADHHFHQERHLHVVCTWEEFQTQVAKQHFDLLYYYGHGIGDKDRSRLVFATDKTQARKDVPIADLAACLRQAPGGPPLLAYVNCCQGDAGGLLGAGRQLLNLMPVVLTNRTTAYIDAAHRQALDFLKAVLLDGIPPNIAVAGMYGRLGNMGLSLKDVRWMTPVLHSRYRNWKANPPRARNPNWLDRNPYWQIKLDRLRQVHDVTGWMRQMLRDGKPKATAYIWYGQKGQGVDQFHERLKVELREDIPHVLFDDKIRPRWPDDWHNLHRSFRDMLLEAFEVDSLDNIPGRIRTQTRGESGRQTLVYMRHQPIEVPPDKPINLVIQRMCNYLEWWDSHFVPLLQLETNAFGLLGISFEVYSPPEFFEEWHNEVEDLELKHTKWHILDEMEQLAKKDLKEYLDTHYPNLPRDRRKRVLDYIFRKTKGHYEMTLGALGSSVEELAWIEDKGTEKDVEDE